MSEVVIDTTKMTERGQVVIPKEVRVKMGLREGSRFMVIATEDSIVFQKIEFVSGKLKGSDLISKAKSIAEKLGLKP